MGDKSNKKPRTLGPQWETYHDSKGVLCARRKDGTSERATPAASSPVDSSPRKLGRKRKEPNRTEAEFGLILRSRYPKSIIQFEPFTLLCDSCRYTPDYVVSPAPDEQPFRLLVFEVKGPFKRAKDVLRLKAAAAQYPYAFTLAERLPDGWRETEIRGMFNR